jgi:hypothetical protein
VQRAVILDFIGQQQKQKRQSTRQFLGLLHMFVFKNITTARPGAIILSLRNMFLLPKLIILIYSNQLVGHL